MSDTGRPNGATRLGRRGRQALPPVIDQTGVRSSSSRASMRDFLNKTVVLIMPVLGLLAFGTVVLFVVGIAFSIISGVSSCTKNMSQNLANSDFFFGGEEGRAVPVSTDSTQSPSPIGKADVLKWLREVRTVPSDNGWERVLMEGVHRSQGKHDCEFITNCSFLGDCVIELAPLDGQSKLSSHGRLMSNGSSFLVDQEKRSIEGIIEDDSGTQSIKVREAQLLYLWRRPRARDLYLNKPLWFKWRLIENRPKKVVRRAFKRDFQPQGGYKESCDFTILPFQLPSPDGGSPIRVQFDLSITFTRLMPKEAKPTVDTPKPDQELLEDLPPVIEMVTVVEGEEECAIFSSEVVENNWRISSEEIRARWLNPDVHKSGRIVIVLKKPMTVHIAYCVRGERW